MSDSLFSGNRSPIIIVLVNFNRDMWAIELDPSLPALRVTRALELITAFRSCPKERHTDFNPVIHTLPLESLTDENIVELKFISTGKPTQNRMSNG